MGDAMLEGVPLRDAAKAIDSKTLRTNAWTGPNAIANYSQQE
jgi:hypothetical protein